jgi:hypothetical protein
VEAGESVKNAEVGRWQVWDTCVQVARPGSCARKGAREPNPRLLMRCRGGKPRRVQSGGDAGVALRCARRAVDREASASGGVTAYRKRRAPMQSRKAGSGDDRKRETIEISVGCRKSTGQ